MIKQFRSGRKTYRILCTSLMLLFVGCSAEERHSSRTKDLVSVENTSALQMKSLVFKDDVTGLVYLASCDTATYFNDPNLCRNEAKKVNGSRGIQESEFIELMRNFSVLFRGKLEYTLVHDNLESKQGLLQNLNSKYESLDKLDSELSKGKTEIELMKRQLATLETQWDPDLKVQKEALVAQLALKTDAYNANVESRDHLVAEIADFEAKNGNKTTIAADIESLKSAESVSILGLLGKPKKLVNAQGNEYYDGTFLVVDKAGIHEAFTAAFRVKRNLLFLHSGLPRAALMKLRLSEQGAFNSVEVFDGKEQLPTLEYLQKFDIILVQSHSQFKDSVAIGDLLADYYSMGKPVVLMTYSNVETWKVSGRFGAEALFICPKNDNIKGKLMPPTESGFLADSIMRTNLTGYQGNKCTLSTGARSIASWDFGSPIVAVQEKDGRRRIEINAYPATDTFDVTFIKDALLLAE